MVPYIWEPILCFVLLFDAGRRTRADGSRIITDELEDALAAPRAGAGSEEDNELHSGRQSDQGQTEFIETSHLNYGGQKNLDP